MYSDNTPSLYIDSTLICPGPKSSAILHPSTDVPDSTQKMASRFVGDLTSFEVIPSAWALPKVKESFDQGLPPPLAEPPLRLLNYSSALIRNYGNYTFSYTNATFSHSVTGTKEIAIQGSWSVTFPANRLPAS